MRNSILFLGILFLAGCNTSDIVAPQAALLVPQSQQVFYTGNEWPVVSRFSDNDLLKQYTLTMLITEDPTIEVPAMMAPFTFGQSIGIVGPTAIDTAWLSVPRNQCSGNYRITIQALDQSGNLSAREEVIVRLNNRDDQQAPTITLQEPIGTITAAPGAPVTVRGSMKDDSQLGGLFMKIIDPPTGSVVTRKVVPFNQLNQVFDQNIKAPNIAGTYTLRIEAADQVNNRTLREFTLTVN